MQGRLTLVLGPQGAGKSALLRGLAGKIAHERVLGRVTYSPAAGSFSAAHGINFVAQRADGRPNISAGYAATEPAVETKDKASCDPVGLLLPSDALRAVAQGGRQMQLSPDGQIVGTPAATGLDRGPPGGQGASLHGRSTVDSSLHSQSPTRAGRPIGRRCSHADVRGMAQTQCAPAPRYHMMYGLLADAFAPVARTCCSGSVPCRCGAACAHTLSTPVLRAPNYILHWLPPVCTTCPTAQQTKTGSRFAGRV